MSGFAGLLFALPVFAHEAYVLPNGYFWEKLPNGLEVLVIENSKVPLATIEIAVKNGAYTEGPEFSGLSHLFEHMFFKANRDYPDQAKFRMGITLMIAPNPSLLSHSLSSNGNLNDVSAFMSSSNLWLMQLVFYVKTRGATTKKTRA